VRGIPYDKRSKETAAFVGSLVGATAVVDPASLHRTDYVRIKIASRDVSKIPEIAEGAILPYLYDFHFEREDEMGGIGQELYVQVPNIRDGDHPSPKRAKIGDQGDIQGQKQLQLGTSREGKSDAHKMKDVIEDFVQAYDDSSSVPEEGKLVVQKMKEVVKHSTLTYVGSSSAPPKVMMGDSGHKLGNLMDDAPKPHVRVSEIRKEKVSMYNSSEDRVQGLSGDHIQEEYEYEYFLSAKVQGGPSSQSSKNHNLEKVRSDAPSVLSWQ
jgi:hypothetical protein